MKRAWKIGGSIFLLILFVAGWSAWTLSFRAPYFVAAVFDLASGTIVGGDPHTRCLTWDDSSGGSVGFVGSRQCYEFGPIRRFHGIYFDEFEGQIFLENERPARPYRTPKEWIWLTLDEKTDRGTLPAHHGKTTVWYVEFVGRKTSKPGGYGHMGGSNQEILVDRVTRAELVQSGDGYLSNQLIRD